MSDWHNERSRLRRWRQPIYHRLFFAIGCVLAAYTWLTLLPDLWFSNIARNAAAALTLWFLLAQAVAFRWLWRWLGPLMRREER